MLDTMIWWLVIMTPGVMTITYIIWRTECRGSSDQKFPPQASNILCGTRVQIPAYDAEPRKVSKSPF